MAAWRRDESVQQTVRGVQRAELQLRELLGEAKRVERAARLAHARPVRPSELVAFAHRVSATTTAPPNRDPQHPSLGVFSPPAPH